MANCPRCHQPVATPFFMDLQGWSRLVCPHCAARLGVKSSRTAFFFPLLLSLSLLARQGHVFAVTAIVLLALGTLLLVLLEILRPQLRLRKHPPEPAIRLDITDPPK